MKHILGKWSEILKMYSPAIALRFVTLDRKVSSLAIAFWNEHSLASLWTMKILSIKLFQHFKKSVAWTYPRFLVGNVNLIINPFQTHIVDHSCRPFSFHRQNRKINLGNPIFTCIASWALSRRAVAQSRGSSSSASSSSSSAVAEAPNWRVYRLGGAAAEMRSATICFLQSSYPNLPHPSP